MALKYKKIGFLGDSITEGYMASSPDKCFVSLFAASHPESKVYNYGIGGTRIAPNKVDEVAEFAHPFKERVDTMADDLDLIVVFGGTNDYGHGDAPLGTFNDRNNDSFYGALYNLYVKLNEKYPAAKIVVLTPIHRVGDTIPTIREDGSHILQDYVEAIKEMAKYFSLPVLDLWSVSGIQPNIETNYKTYTADGLHPNDYGYARLFEIVDKYISNL